MNRHIELHDSRVARIDVAPDFVHIHLDRAYVHQSIGRPGIDPGTGWTQEARLSFEGASFVGAVPELPLNLVGGELSINESRWQNAIPVPLEVAGAIRLVLEFAPSVHVLVMSATARLELLGHAKYVEEFRP